MNNTTNKARVERSAEVQEVMTTMMYHMPVNGERLVKYIHQLEAHAQAADGVRDKILDEAASICDQQAELRPLTCKWEQRTCELLAKRIRALKVLEAAPRVEANTAELTLPAILDCRGPKGFGWNITRLNEVVNAALNAPKTLEPTEES